jgi:predicted dehydrogenase
MVALAVAAATSWHRGYHTEDGIKMTTPPLRFALVGTGYWARIAHAPALASADGVELAAVWGRNQEAAAALAAAHQATAYEDIDAMLAAVDGVAFAVPPDVQAPIAAAAARAGKHLLLEKPIAISEAEADDLVEAVTRGQVASVVFFTLRFQAAMRAWLAEVTARGEWTGGIASWFGSSLLESSPFNSPWRREKGALWDIAPHVVSLLWAVLGPVTSVTADGGPADVSHLILHHRDGASSTVTVSQSAGEKAAGLEAFVWGSSGRSAAPAAASDPVPPLRTALAELTGNIHSGRTAHPCDVRFGRDVGHVIAEAQRQIDQRRAGERL